MPYLMHSRAHLKGVGCGVAIEPVASWKRCRASFGGYAWSGCQSHWQRSPDPRDLEEKFEAGILLEKGNYLVRSTGKRF
jgi:hypothetical protein